MSGPACTAVRRDLHTSVAFGREAASDKIRVNGTLSVTFRSGADSRGSINSFESYPARREVDFYSLWKFTPRDQIRLTLANILSEDYFSTSRYVDASGTRGDSNRTPSRMEIRVNLESKF
jgi:outer membrane receptor for ferrienterochelin and colicins